MPFVCTKVRDVAKPLDCADAGLLLQPTPLRLYGHRQSMYILDLRVEKEDLMEIGIIDNEGQKLPKKIKRPLRQKHV